MAENNKKELTVDAVRISTGTLRSLWETGVPLDNAWLEFSESGLDKFAFKMLRTHPCNDVAFADDPRFRELQEWLPPSEEGRERKLQITRDVERSHLLDALYADRLWAVGFVTKPDGFDEPTRVPREFFFLDYDGERPDRPQIYWSNGELIGRGVSYFDIHVVRPPPQGQADSDSDSNAVSRGDECDVDIRVAADESIDTESPQPSREFRSTAEVVKAAIEHYAIRDPDLSDTPAIRFRAYRDYAKDQGYRPYKDRGFSNKTLEAYETKFRNKIR